MNKPFVSILIPAFNSEAWIERTILSAVGQTWPFLEIIVVDDGSTDKTLAIAEKYKKQIKIFSQPNKGASAARNKAFKESSGSYIQYLDADDLLAPDKIERQLECLAYKDECSISSSAWGMFIDTPEKAHFKTSALWQNFSSPIDWLVMAWTEKTWMTNSAWLTPRKLIDEAGSWNEGLSLHDDGEFFCRVLLKSTRIKFCLEAKSYYRKGISSSLSSQRSKKAIGSHYRICQLYANHLLMCENTERTRNAVAANYQSFIYDGYPENSDYIKQAYAEITKLGETLGKPTGSPMFNLLKLFLGWKLARRVEQFAYRNNFNRSAIHQLVQKFLKL